MSFDGSFRSARKVNLRGQSAAQSDRDLLLKLAHTERTAREHDRLRIRSAIRIQSVWRGRRLVAISKQHERSDWHSSLLSNQDNLIKVSRSLLYFFHPRQDQIRLDALCTTLLAPTPPPSSLPTFVVFLHSAQQYTEWLYIFKKLLILCMQNCTTNDELQSPSDLRPSAQLLKAALDPQLNQSPELVAALAQHSVQHGLFTIIANYIATLPTERKQKPLATVLVEILNEALSLVSPRFFDNFISGILTIPLLPIRLPLEAVTSLSAIMPFDAIITGIASSDSLIQKIREGGVPVRVDPFGALLTNILMFGQGRVQKMSQIALLNYVSALQRLLLYTSDVFFEHRPSTMPAVMDVDHDDDEVMMPTIQPRSVDPRLLKWLNILFDASHLGGITKLALSLISSASAVESVAPIMNFFLALTDRWPGRKLEVLAIVGAAGDLIQILCDKLLPVWEARLGGRITLESVSDPANASSWVILAFVCELYSRMLLTMGDDEFFGEKTPLKLSAVVSLSRILKTVTFGLYWNDPGSSTLIPVAGTTLVMQQLRSLFTQLLFSIHSRDSRRPFTPPNHWLAALEIDLPSFVAAAVSEDTTDLSSRQMRVIGARQAILNNIPFVIPFENRVTIFRQYISNDRSSAGDENEWHRAVASATIRRQHVFEDGYTYLNALGTKLKKKIGITFVDEQGMIEAGIDGGGLFKEFLTTLSKQAFDMNYGLFSETRDHLLYPSPQNYATQDSQLNYFEFLGRILGKALYEGILIDVAFAKFFLSKWLGRQSYLDDLPSLDPDLYHSLMFLKNYTGDVEKDLMLTFTKDESEFGTTRTIELIPCGASVPVTNENRIRYIYLVANYWLNQQIGRQCRAFFKGLSDLIDPKWLRMFNQEELQILIGGASIPIDLTDLQRNIVYEGGFSADHLTIQAFWKVVRGLNEEERQLLLKFVTSCARPPLLGFSALKPLFCIRNAGDEQDRLPSASTCVNLLKMPAYIDVNKLREKLLYAINSGAGFHLS
ncbi:hypothetical protein SeMB42_g07460 [Synchytrium endobioticum]|uniref:HECT-type E3 ubiquitin transferase n=1 Tax=Synchytrium endobioticum TaxID=286115 RepID=A0A507D835_9FUNG|nr:hypothetical protein SeMB42_g07460 [Synchytrium endobioticum]TPX47571.1 hypothetical protein SeLEV6574_g02571 [Synchytrium endobioticum]